MEEQRFSPEEKPALAPPQPKEGGGCFRTLAIGCLVVFVLAVVTTVVIALNIRRIFASGAQAIATAVLEQANLPEDKRKLVKEKVDELLADFKAGKVDWQDLRRGFQEFSKSPLLPISLVYAAQEKYIKHADVPQAEKDQAVLTLERFARGAFERRIPQGDIEQVLALIQDKAGQRGEFKKALTTEELRGFLRAAAEKADAAKVPAERFQVDVAQEITAMIAKIRQP